MLFSPHGGDWGTVELTDSIRTKVLRQEHKIDVLACVNDHVLLIEDKTNTYAHHGQLTRYWNLVSKERRLSANLPQTTCSQSTSRLGITH